MAGRVDADCVMNAGGPGMGVRDEYMLLQE